MSFLQGMPLILGNRSFMKKQSRFFIVVLILGCAWCAQSVFADDGNNIALITRGVARTLFSVFEIPKDMMANAGNAFPLGLVTGAVTGTVKTVVGTVVGATEIARGAAPYAKYAALAL